MQTSSILHSLLKKKKKSFPARFRPLTSKVFDEITADRIFLLNEYELQYVLSPGSMGFSEKYKAQLTPYMKKQKGIAGSCPAYGSWLLRDNITEETINPEYVSGDGHVCNVYRNHHSNKLLGIRPALWVQID